MSNIIKFNPNPVTDFLIDNWQTIRDEYIAQRLEKIGVNLLERQDESNKLNGLTYHQKKPLFEGSIQAAALYLKYEVLSAAEITGLNWQKGEESRVWQDNIDGMPTIKKWMSNWFEHLASVVFYTAQPGAKINHHYGVDAQRDKNIRVHLCLTEDPQCVFDIENERYVWKEGHVFAFDDTGFYHGIKHEGTNPRSVLVFDISRELMRPFAINWTERPFIPHHARTPPTILDW